MKNKLNLIIKIAVILVLHLITNYNLLIYVCCSGTCNRNLPEVIYNLIVVIAYTFIIFIIAYFNRVKLKNMPKMWVVLLASVLILTVFFLIYLMWGELEPDGYESDLRFIIQAYSFLVFVYIPVYLMYRIKPFNNKIDKVTFWSVSFIFTACPVLIYTSLFIGNLISNL